MSDYDRGKFYGKKRYPRSELGHGRSFFNSKSSFSRSESDFYKEKDENKDKSSGVKQPTILLKARDKEEDRSVSPKRQTAKEGDQPSGHITIATPAASESAAPPVVKQMNRRVMFIGDGVIYTEHVQEYLEENNDFVVIGVVGTQGVGKSTIMNLLANKSVTEPLKKALFANVDNDSDSDGFENIKILTESVSSKLKLAETEIDSYNLTFELQNSETIQNNYNATTGVDLFITQNRVILLDCQPILSAAILDDIISSDEHKRPSSVSDCLPLENNGEIQSLQLTAFLMSVCHVLIFVQDWFFDSNLVRFLQTAEMLKPTMSNPEDDSSDYFPHLIILHNKAQMDDFTPKKFKTMQQFYKTVFNKTKMHLESGMGLGTGRIIPSLCPENCGDPINLFLIPEYDENDRTYKGHPPLEDLIKRLRANILGCTKYPLTHVTLSEKNWLVYSAKVWDHVKKSSFFVEYSKLMP